MSQDAAASAAAAEPRVVRIAIGAIAGCMTAALLYSVMRIVQSLLMKEPDPALIIYSEHAGFFWRAWTVSYFGGMIGFVVYVLAAKNALRTTRVLSRVLFGIAIIAALQGILVP